MNTSPGSETSEEGEPLLGTRRQARELALSLLYEADTKEVAPGVVLADFPIDPDPFAADLVGGVDAHQSEIDDLIRRFAKDWTIERMPVVDRNLLR
ncbi:MAG: transcription antitermination protein NusB, partial [Acidimicrobiia bacterium]|nr:transcription antitermination protein NusB [Acidimicrobiia bacterium]